MISFSCLKDLIEKPLSGEWGDGVGDIKVIRTANFTNEGTINFDNIVSRNISDNKVQTKRLLKHDIIIEKSGGSPSQPVGRVVFFEENGVFLCNNFTSILRPKKDKIFPKYLHYILYCNHKYKFVEKFQNKTTGIINLQLPKYIKNTTIPTPSIAEQQKIAATLDKADSLRQKDQQLIEHYTALSRSLFLEMFGDPVGNPMGWEKVLFSKVAENLDSKRVPIKQSDRENQQGKYPYYGATGIVDYINDYIFDGEHLLIAEDGKNLDNRKKPIAWIAKKQFWVNNHAHIVKSNDCSNLRYIEYHLNQMDISQYVTGIDQFKMNKSNLNRIPIMSVPIELQNQFSERIESIEQQKQQAQANLEKSEALFNSLLQRAFKGELTH